MKGQGFIRVILVLAMTGLTLSYQACSKTNFSTGQDSGRAPDGSGKDPGVPAANGGTTTDNPKPTVDLMTSPFASTQVQNPQLCLGAMTFVKAGATVVLHQHGSNRGPGKRSSSSRFLPVSSLGRLLALLPAGSFVDSIALAPGVYDEVDVQLDPSCPSGSLVFTDSSGQTISTKEPLVLRFRGPITVNPADAQIVVDVQPLIDNLATVTCTGDLNKLYGHSSHD